MKNITYILILLLFTACSGESQNNKTITKTENKMDDKVVKTDEEWKKVLSPEQFDVLRKKGTEMPYSGKYYLHKGKGIYVCAACGAELFRSDKKFDAGCGWPSF